VGIKEVVINQRAENQALRKQLSDCKSQNAKLRALALHGAECPMCRMVETCADRQRLFKEAFSRQLQTLRTPDRER